MKPRDGPMPFPLPEGVAAAVSPMMLRPGPALFAASLAALSLALLAVAPSAAATEAVAYSCGADLWFAHADYSCHVSGIGPSGSVVWCPDSVGCANLHLVGCTVDSTPPHDCQIL